MNTEILKKIESLFKENNNYLRTKQLREKRITSKNILFLLQENWIERVKRGLYRWNGEESLEEYNELVEVCKIVPSGVICLLSALSYYELTTYNPSVYQIAIHEDATKPRLPGYPPIKLIFFSDTSYSTGITEAKINGNYIKIYDIEKTICDCVRYRNKIGVDLIKEALQNYVKRKGKNISKLMDYAYKLKVRTIIQKYLEVLL